MRARSAGRRASGLLLAVACLAPGAGTPSRAQALPGATRECPAEPPPGDPARIARMEERVRQLEARVQELARQLDAPEPSPPAPPPRIDSPAPLADLPLKVTFGPGFSLASRDDEFQLQFHYLGQFDGRFFLQGGQDPVKNTFATPREWFIFNGRLTRSFDYLVSFAHGFGTTSSLLDAWLNLHIDDRFQIKAGRYFVPFSFEPYILPVHALITPEWSLFFNNFEPNRDLGVMAWGLLSQKRFEYAAGVFNGNKNGFVDTNNAKDVIGFFNAKPFLVSGIPALENLNVSGSVEYGNESSPPNPPVLRTIVSIPGNATIGVPFLAFNNNVVESGPRALWALDVAYYYRQLSVIGEWDGGYQSYALGNGPFRTRLPLSSYFIEAGYFLTGETVAARGVVRPVRAFSLRKGKLGPGAWELAGRYDWLGLGGQVFTHGLADPNLWSNRVATVDVGVNWYWNPYVKVAVFWEHAEFGSPVLYRPGARQLTSDLFLARLQFRY